MRIAFDELIPDGDEVVRVRLCWSRQEADLIGAVLDHAGFDYAEEKASEGWSVYTSASDAPRAMALLEHDGLDRSENVFNAGL
jgi:hypothetical protein